MAAYASLVSLMHIIDQLENHPRPPITLDKQQVQSLTKTITFLQEFLESNDETEGLESRIVDAANAAEDTIESHIVDQIHAGPTGHSKKRISSIEFNQSLEKLIQNLDLIKEEVEKIKYSKMVTFAPSNPSPSMGKNSPMVGFDDISYKMRDKLIQSKDGFQVVPVVGMAGIGKTTLARSIFLHQGVTRHFDFLAWTTISQEYNLRKILLELLHESEDGLSYMDDHDLADMLHRKLKGRRYLIIMDDIWDVEVWDRLKFFFPDDENGSRVILTTRLSNLASQITNNVGLNMTFLDEDNSWELFSKTVFGFESCPLELEEVGKSIVRNCRGLPLSIVVVGGLLAKSKPSQEYWEAIAENLNSVVNSEDDERCLKILHMSYTHLPVHLKPCFLYMGVFREDSELRYAMLVKLWVAEGFLKPVSGKTFEEVAEDCIKDLIDRNLVLVHKLGSTGNIKYCKIHDLLRDLSLRESQKERFYDVIKQQNPNPPQSQRIVVPQSIITNTQGVTSLSTPLIRSLICDINGNLQTLDFRLLRVFESFAKYSVFRLYSLQEMFMFVNLRYLAVRLPDPNFPSSINSLWNLHTLIVHNDSDEEECDIKAPVEIWDMPQLRHIDIGSLYLTNTNIDGRNCAAMTNLHTLKTAVNFKCGDEVIRRIRKIKKLSLDYREFEDDGVHHLENLDRLTLLESFSCYIDLDKDSSRANHILETLTFPKSLKKLKIGGVDVYWETLIRKLGFLNIQVLKLMHGRFGGRRWETVDGQFKNLRFLIVEECMDLEMWESKSSHFPRLERIVLRLLRELKEIPLGFAEIATLQSIEMAHCNEALIVSAKRIVEEQEELFGVESTEVQVYLTRKSEVIESLATPKFQIRYL